MLQVTERVYEFAEELFKSMPIEVLSMRHRPEDAPGAAELDALGLDARQWSLASSAALHARKTGEDIRSVLQAAAKFYNRVIERQSGHETFALQHSVATAPRR